MLHFPSFVAMSQSMKLLVTFFFMLSYEIEAYGGKKKGKFMAHIPGFIKFLMFWWCVIVTIILLVYIVDRMMYRWKGPALIEWTIDHVFDGKGKREDYWAQFVNPTKWGPTHPILASADVRMVQMTQEKAIKDSGTANGEKDGKEKKPKDDGRLKVSDKDQAEDEEEFSPGVKPVPLKALDTGFGFMLRHKKGTPHERMLFCTRECTEMSTPKDGTWRFAMRTIEVGLANFFLAGTEETDLEMLPADEHGKIWCQMHGKAACESRFQRWWLGLRKQSMLGAEGMMDAIAEEVGRKGKKKD